MLRTKRKRERQVNELLRVRGLETYLPVYPVPLKTPGRVSLRPFFPNYMFIHLDLTTADLSQIEWTPGVGHLVRFGGQLATIPDGTMGALRRRLESVRLQKVDPLGDIKRGDRVRLTAAPFIGHEAIFDTRLPGSERVRVFLNWLGRLVAAEVNMRDLYRVQRRPR